MNQQLPVTYRGIVYPWHCDHMGHMNVMWYVGKFDEATWHFVSLFGGTPTYLKNAQRGMVAGEQRIVYKRELLAGNLISIRSGLTEVTEKTFRFFHEMSNEETGEIAAITWLRGVHIDAVLRKACPMPAEMIERAKSMVSDYQPAQ
jgi:acyl-CoA thioester hydrolase